VCSLERLSRIRRKSCEIGPYLFEASPLVDVIFISEETLGDPQMSSRASGLISARLHFGGKQMKIDCGTEIATLQNCPSNSRQFDVGRF
jgi:hypothetical protein